MSKGHLVATSTSTTMSIIKSSYAKSWNVQVGEVVFNWEKVGDHSSSSFDLIGQVKLPAKSYVMDVQVHGVTLWDSGAAVSLIVGDQDDDNGFYEATNLKSGGALTAGEVFAFNHDGGEKGAYVTDDDGALGGYSASARTVIGKVTVTNHGTAVSAGETRMLVVYCCPPVDTIEP